MKCARSSRTQKSAAMILETIESVRRRTQHHGSTPSQFDWEYERGKDPAGHTPPQVVPGTWFRGHESAPSDRVHPSTLLQTLWGCGVRREEKGDADPSKAIIADTMKLVSFLFHSFIHKGVGTIYIFTYRKNLYLCLSLRWAIQAMVRRSPTN